MLITGGGSMVVPNTEINRPSKSKNEITTYLSWIKGVAFTFLIAFLGYLLAMVPGFTHVGQLACAIIIAVIYRQIFGYPEALRVGITFSSKKLLRLAIILYGLKLNIDKIGRAHV